MAVKAGDPMNSGVQLMRIRNGLLRPVSAYKSIRLGIPANAQDRDQNGQEADGKNEF